MNRKLLLAATTLAILPPVKSRSMIIVDDTGEQKIIGNEPPTITEPPTFNEPIIMNSPRPIANPFKNRVRNHIAATGLSVQEAIKRTIIPQHERDLIAKAQAKRERKHATKTLTT